MLRCVGPSSALAATGRLDYMSATEAELPAMRPTPILPPPAAPEEAAAAQLAAEPAGLRLCVGVVMFLARRASPATCVEGLAGSARLREPRQVRAAGHDAHPRADGSLIAEYARERRIFVPINSIPKRVIAAFLSAEDKRFYEHGGVDFTGHRPRRFKVEQPADPRHDKRAEGASTITQQVAKNFLLTSERTIERKLKEAILAIRIERAYSKDKILELYLNEIYLGIGAYGVAAAGLSYFNKELQDLTIEEAAYLAALPRRPTTIIRSAREGGDDPPQLDHRPDGRERLHHGGRGRGGQGEAARASTSARPARTSSRPTIFAEEVGARSLERMYGEDKALQRRPVGPHHARSRPAAAWRAAR